MTFLEKTNAYYEQAQAFVDMQISAGPQTAQARYDLKKAQRRGHTPRKQTTGLERMKHELATEQRYLLKGGLEMLAYLYEHYPHIKCTQLDAEIRQLEEALYGNN